MSRIAVVGAGPLGGAVTDALARRGRVREVRLIDAEGTVARGKALDILQAAPIEAFATRVSSAEGLEAASGTDVIVIADTVAGVEHKGESGLALLRRLLATAGVAPILFAGADARDLIGRLVGERRVARTRALGSAPLALESALRALAALAIDSSGAEVHLRVVGVPPRDAVVAWEEATVEGQPLTAALPAHVLAALTARLPRLWPPGPYALAAAAARIAEGLANGSRRRLTCFVALDAGPARVSVAAMPVELERGGWSRVLEPALTRQERTLLENALEA
jgi:malate dehydrogenase